MVFTLVVALLGQAPASCVDAAEAIAPLQKRGALIEALEQARRCSAETCTRAIRDYCRPQQTQLEADLPSAVFSVESAGAALPTAALQVDGVEVAPNQPVQLDPRVHRLAATLEGYVAGEVEFGLNRGEKRKPVVISLVPVSVTAATPASPSPTFPAWPWVTSGALAVGGWAVFGVLGISVRNDRAKLETTCSPGCLSSQVTPVRFNAAVADVGLVAGSLFTVLAAVLLWRWVAG